MTNAILPVLILTTSFITGLLIFVLEPRQHVLRNALNLLGAGLKVVLVGLAVWGVLDGWQFETRYSLALGFDLLLRIDKMSLLMLTLSTALWFVTTVYAIGYLKGGQHLNRFFGFFSLCVTASVGVALSGNLITFFIFYEFLTLTTYPLVVHKGTEEALRAGRVYLSYTITGGSVFFLGVVWLNVLGGPLDFQPGGHLGELWGDHSTALAVSFFLLIFGLGVKAALVPLHGWLPLAMVAPAPVSALLHAVAVVKAGAFGIVRVIYEVYGVAPADDAGLLGPLGALAAVTIVWGSLCAIGQTGIKKLLAYSTISQLSYIVLGASVLGQMATVGSVVHLIHQGVMKITLFFCAGAFESELKVKEIPQMRGLGQRMPYSMAAFTVAALGMIGVPPTAGFVTKWYLGLGGLEAGAAWVPGVLLLSTVLNAIYFLPLLYYGWFTSPEEPFPPPKRRTETSRWLLYPLLATAAVSLLAGLFAGSPWSPVELSQRVAEGMYQP